MAYLTFVAFDADGEVILEWRNQPDMGPESDAAKETFIAATPGAKTRMIEED